MIMIAATRPAHILVPLAALLVIYGCSTGDEEAPRKVGRDAHIDRSAGRLSACGELVAGTVDSASRAAPDDRFTFSTTYVRDDGYGGMEDNDLRGFLDGAFKEGWNQVSQTHLRLGRRARNPAYGEYELFRNLQRWDGIELPANATVVDAEVRLRLESGPPYPADVAVYAVRKDWSPGAGGLNRDNNSPPSPGEVWWLDAAYGSTPWAIAGADHASDTDPDADTYGQALALARYAPGDVDLSFRSDALAAYVEDRVRSSKPVLLLYKLTDPYEDSVGSVFEIWSANAGVVGSDRRPRLTLRWQAPLATIALRRAVTLEPGRTLIIADLEATPGETLAASFEQDMQQQSPSCSQDLHIEYRAANSGWLPLDRPALLTADSVDLRLTAAMRPVALGSRIELRIRDTWIPRGTPDEHAVVWTVRRPDGRTQEIETSHAGDFTWRLSMRADVPGRWSFRWRHELSGSRKEGDWHTLDVVARELAAVRDSLKQLETEIRDSGASPRSHAMLPFEMAFMRLERSAVRLAVDADNPAVEEEIGIIIRRLRQALSGREVPDEFVPQPIKAREVPTGG